MGRYSHWNLYVKSQDGSSIEQELDQINAIIEDNRSELRGIPHKNIFEYLTGELTEAFMDYEDYSYSSQDYVEHDLKFLSQRFPTLVFHCAADIEDGPSFYINAKAGELDYNIPEVIYPGFKSILYQEEADKPACPYSQDDLKLSISDMEKLTEMVKAKAPAGTFSAGAPTTEIASWALKAVLEIYYGEVLK